MNCQPIISPAINRPAVKRHIALAFWLTLPLLLTAAALACFALHNSTALAAPPANNPSAAAAGKTVTLIVDYGDGLQKHFTALAFKPKMTVLDALLAAQKHPRGIRVQYRGSGQTAFVEKIDDLKNEGNGRNWIFRVNGKLSNRGCGVVPLVPGDTVLWKFGKYR